MEPKLKVKEDENDEKIDPIKYIRVVRCLSYLTHTELDLSYEVGVASHFIEQPTTLKFQVVKDFLQYVKGTPSYMLNY